MKIYSKSFISREIQINMSIKCLFIATLVTTMKRKKKAGNSGIGLQTQLSGSLKQGYYLAWSGKHGKTPFPETTNQ